MTVLEILVIFTAALLAGALNAVAGGGSFLTFPALVFVGIPDVEANVTNSLVLWPGSIASTGAYRNELLARRRTVLMLSIASLLGGIIGALLLLDMRDQQETFRNIVPYLLLITTLLFAFGKYITRWLQKHINMTEESRLALVSVVVLQCIISVYGGFFGGGMGVMMLAAYSLLGMSNIHIMNGIKSLVSVLIKGIAVLTFIYYDLFIYDVGVIAWPQAIVMIVGATIGGYWGAAYARKLDPELVRRFAVAVGIIITILFFLRA
ncbi:MAG: sulfite exporter TauE/SafE family protein [Blastochloris sp.]|nr:sulfite exporter TauE/SafE family protein [Blastochloris sp.]